MKNDVYFENIKQIGNLMLDYIFYEFESEPIIFTCVDSKKKLYLCLCSEIRYEQKWIIAECKISTLKALIFKEIDLVDAFIQTKTVNVVTMDMQGKEENYIIDTKMLDELDLPQVGVFLLCDQDSAYSYYWKKQLENLTEQAELLIPKEKLMDRTWENYIAEIDSSILNSSKKDSELLDLSSANVSNYSINLNRKYISITNSMDQSNAQFYINAA